MLKTYQNLDFDHLKKVYKMLKLGIFPVFDKIFTANILGIWEKRILFTPDVSSFHNTAVRALS